MSSIAEPGKQARLRDYRYPGEFVSLTITLLVLATLFALAVRFFPSSTRQAGQILIVTAVALAVYIVTVIVQQRSVFGTMVRVSPRQFPEIHQLAVTASERLATPLVPVYVRRSSEQQIYTLGFLGQPLIVITSSMIDQMPKDNLLFFIGRETGHIMAGHTWLRTLLKPVGSEVPVIGKLLNSVIFGDWINRAEFTADRAGFIACGSLTSAVTGMLRFGVGISLYEKLDVREFLEQINDVRNVGSRVADIIADQPYLTDRVRRLVRFALHQGHRERNSNPHTKILSSLPRDYLNTDEIPLAQPSMELSDTPGLAVPLAVPLATSLEQPIAEPGARPARDNGNVTAFPGAVPRQSFAETPAPVPETNPDFAVADDNAHNPLWRLIAVDTSAPHILRGRCTRIGRNVDNDIVVNSDRASRYHAEILHENGRFSVHDKESRNGVWVNGVRVLLSAPLQPGDVIRIGRQEFSLSIPEQEQTANRNHQNDQRFLL
ncbi:MAG: FHA domain-containing protein [Blastocatellia bacterium]